MQITIDCPLCNGGKISVETKLDYKPITTGKMKDLPCRAFCKNCNRFIKYALVKKE